MANEEKMLKDAGYKKLKAEDDIQIWEKDAGDGLKYYLSHEVGNFTNIVSGISDENDEPVSIDDYNSVRDALLAMTEHLKNARDALGLK